VVELLNKISSDNLLLLCVVLSVIALFLAVAVTIEIFSNYRKKKDVILTSDGKENNEINVKKDENIIYVEEDDELEKTRAKLELEKLKERLKEEEKEKQRLLELNLALSKNANNKEINSNSEGSTTVVENVKVEEKKQLVEEKVIPEKIEVLEKEEVTKPVEVTVKVEVPNSSNNKTVVVNEVKDTVKEESLVDRLSVYEELEEENAIISYDELKKATNFGYTDEEMDKYVDENDAIISITELEKLYKESNNIKEVELKEFEFKRVEDLPKISEEKKFQSTPFISPVYGIGVTEESISLEQTANLEKLNEEIKKTNEFLKALKELKKNLQ